MKKKSRGKKNRGLRAAALHKHCLVGAALLVSFGVARAAEEKAEAEEVEAPDNSIFEGGTNTFNNWVEFSVGGMLIDGNKSQAQQSRRLPDDAFGGISDFHYQSLVATNTSLTVDGRGIYDHDYNLSVALAREEAWFLRLHFENYRTWYNGDGGYFPSLSPTDNFWYPLAGDAVGLDRGEISVEGGLTLKNWPALNFKYSHLTRDGQKGSTTWGQSHPLFTSLTRGLNASFYDIDETRDIFELNAKHKIKSTDFGLGLRYETGDLDNARYISQWPGEPVARKISDREGTSYDLFNVHAFSETWLKKNLFFSTGYLYANLDSDYSGSRIYGSDFDVSYAPNALNGTGYYDLDGGGQKQEHIVNLNLMYNATKPLTIVPSIRVRREDWNANSGAFQTSGNNVPGFLDSNTDGDLLDVRERIDVRYTGLTNSVLYAQAEWTQGDGNLDESGTLTQMSGTMSTNVLRRSEDSRFFQKYSAGWRWYPTRSLHTDVGGYYKLNAYDYDHDVDNTVNSGTSANRYPAYLTMQDFETYDGYFRLTIRPLPNLTLVSRYEYQLSTIHTQPDAASGLGEVQSSEMTSHIIAQNVSWAPWSRIYFQVGFNYVLSETESPVASGTEATLDQLKGANYTKAILEAQNNYWTLNFNTGLTLDSKSDLNLGYTYYRADNYSDYEPVAASFGSGAEEHGITATITRRISERVRVSLRYGYYHSEDELSGGNNDYEAHVLFSSLQYRF